MGASLTLLWFSRGRYISVLLARPSTEQPALYNQTNAPLCFLIFYIKKQVHLLFFLNKPLCATNDSHHREHDPNGQTEVHIQHHHWQPGDHPNYLDKNMSATPSMELHSWLNEPSFAALTKSILLILHSSGKSWNCKNICLRLVTLMHASTAWGREEASGCFFFNCLISLQHNMPPQASADLWQEVEERSNQQQDNENDQAGEQARELRTQAKAPLNNCLDSSERLISPSVTLPVCDLQRSPVCWWWPELPSWGSRWKRRIPCWRRREPTAPAIERQLLERCPHKGASPIISVKPSPGWGG